MPARFAVQVIRDAAAAGARSATIVTSGFSELQDEESQRLAAELQAVVRETRLAVTGPNCLGNLSAGEKLFTKVGRRLVLTEMGRVVYRYAEEIFTLGREMVDTVKGRATGQPVRLSVGIADSVPKLIVRRLLEPAWKLDEPVRLMCHEDDHDQLLADLALSCALWVGMGRMLRTLDIGQACKLTLPSRA